MKSFDLSDLIGSIADTMILSRSILPDLYLIVNVFSPACKSIGIPKRESRNSCMNTVGCSRLSMTCLPLTITLISGFSETEAYLNHICLFAFSGDDSWKLTSASLLSRSTIFSGMHFQETALCIRVNLHLLPHSTFLFC